MKNKITYAGGLLLETPAASPALIGVGYIVGPRVAAVLFSGAVLGWLLLVPLAIFLNPALTQNLAAGQSMVDLSMSVWKNQIRPLAVGTMIVAAFYTLYGLRNSLIGGIQKAFKDFSLKGGGNSTDRTEIDLNLKKVFIAIAILSIPMFFLYNYFAHSIPGSLLLTVVMLILGFLFTAVAGYLVGMIGSSNNPISGLTLSTLLISAVLMVALGVTGIAGVAAVLAIAGVICCAAGIAGDMMQDLKVGHILGGTPWRMQIAEIIGVIAAALVLALPLSALDKVYHIGSAELPAPQAGLMALMAQGIVGGEMAWPLVIVGIFFAIGLILINAPSPMLIAVGMYLPFESTAAIFVGGLIKWLLQRKMEKANASTEEQTRAENLGTLLSSGFIAGEALMAVLLAFVVLGQNLTGGEGGLMHIADNFWLGLLIYPILIYLLVTFPFKKMKEGGIPTTRVD
ncbi:MAG: oligopeptide transporter, OPT family [candidate division KSB1 bacterium]|nr:oligopeptide transporter, OPT family [candidate division KSB1 bacterium]